MGTRVREEIPIGLQSGLGGQATVNKRSGDGLHLAMHLPVACWNGRRRSSAAV